MRYVFIDRIERIEKNKYARGIKTISFEEGFLKSPYGEDGFFPQLLLIESAAQLVSWLIMHGSGFNKIPILAKMEKITLLENVKSGAKLIIETKILSSTEEGAFIKADIYSDNKLIAKGENCMCVLTDLERFADKSEMEAIFLDLSKNAEFR